MSVAAPEQASPRAIPGAALGVCGLLIAIGAIAFAGGLATDPTTAWRAFHLNYLYFGGIAQGGIVLACALVIVGARWPGPVRRIAEGLGAWVPLTVVLFVVDFLGGRHHVYEWIEHPIAVKAPYLSEGRLFLMNFLILLLLAILSYLFLKASVRPALRGAADRSSGVARGLFERWTTNWQGEAAEREVSERRLRRLAPGICLLFAFGWSFIGLDQVMSLEPTWYSNLFPAFFAWGAFLCAICLTTLLCVLHARSPGLEGHITKARLHDLGKMIFAFSIFWMYLFFAQYLVIWYGNLPEETGFLRDRLGPQFLQETMGFANFWSNIWDRPWVPVTLFTWICIWVIPFWFLLGQKPKKTGWFLGAVAAIAVFGFWMERNVLIWPSLEPANTWAWFGWIQLGIALGFLGAFALVFLLYTRVFPSLAVPQRA